MNPSQNTLARMTRSAVTHLFQDLIWPAAAGNVAWSFFTMAVGEKWLDPGVPARLLVIFLLAIYLGVDWMRTTDTVKTLKGWFWIADAPHSASVVVFAIATQMNKSWLGGALAAMFVIGVIGHLIGAWEPTGTVNNLWRKRLILAVVNAAGLIPLILLPQADWRLPVALGLVLVLWFPARYLIIPQLN
jgi:hypothetical protein